MRNLLIEQVLDSNPDIAWEYRESVPLSTVDRKRSLDNQARVGAPIDPELVNQYVRATKQGDEFPALVAYEDGKSLVNIDGNHRYEAFVLAKKPTHDFYIVLTNNEVQRTALTFEFNTYNGRPQSDATRSAQVVTLKALGFDNTQIAARLHLSKNQVQDSILEDAGRTRALHNGVKMAWDKIESRQSRIRIASLPLDKVFALAVQYASKYGLPHYRVSDLVRQVKENTSEETQLQFIRSEIASAEEKAKHKSGRFREPAPLFDAVLSHLMKIDTENVVRSMTNEEKKQAREKLNLVAEKIDKTLSLLD